MMKHSRLSILTSICLLLGLGLGFVLDQPDKKLNLELIKTQELLSLQQDENLRYALAKKKIEIFTENHMLEYHALIDQKEKYQKADDILSKVMLIFLADLGIHLSSKNKKWVRQTRMVNEQNSFKHKKENNNEKEELVPTAHRFTESEAETEAQEISWEMEKLPINNAIKKNQFREESKIFRRFFDKLDSNIKSLIRYDKEINILAANKIYKGRTHPANKSLVNYYLGKRKGFIRRGKKTNLKIAYHLRPYQNTIELEYKVKLKFNTLGDSYTAIQLNDTFTAVHPHSHNSKGEGPCRFLILKGLNGLRIYLTNVRGKNMIFGRILNINRKKPTLGFFLLEKY
jgi:hypothetical protein